MLTSGTGTTYPSRAPEFPPIFSGVRVTRSLVSCVCFVDRCMSFYTLNINESGIKHPNPNQAYETNAY